MFDVLLLIFAVGWHVSSVITWMKIPVVWWDYLCNVQVNCMCLTVSCHINVNQLQLCCLIICINIATKQQVINECLLWQCPFLFCAFLIYMLHFNCSSVLWHCWLGGRKGIRPVEDWVMGCWRGYLSGARCRLAYGSADATASLLLQ